MEREGTAVTCDGRPFHRRVTATGNALSPTVDRRVRRTPRDVDEAERSRRQHIKSHFREESFQAINCTGTDNTKQTGENTQKTQKNTK